MPDVPEADLTRWAELDSSEKKYRLRDMPNIEAAAQAWNEWYESGEREHSMIDSSTRGDHAAFNAGWSAAHGPVALAYRDKCTEVERQRAELVESGERWADKASELADAAGCIQDVIDHATPLGHDGDGFVAVGYGVSVGAIHRAIGWLQGAYVRSGVDAIVSAGDSAGLAPRLADALADARVQRDRADDYGARIDATVEVARSMAQDVNVLPLFRALGVIASTEGNGSHG